VLQVGKFAQGDIMIARDSIFVLFVILPYLLHFRPRPRDHFMGPWPPTIQ
jgi:hypothetical protein